jgi:hypothetical protein
MTFMSPACRKDLIPADSAIEGPALVLKVADAEERTPAIVAALVAAGAGVVEVRPEMPALEDVYLRLMGR